MSVSLNQYCGEIRSFYNRLTNQITELTNSLFNILANFTDNVSVYIILIQNMVFLTFLDQLSSCNITYLWNFMTQLFYFRLLTSFLAYYLFKSIYLCYAEILDRIQVLGLIPVKGHWNLNSIVAHNYSKTSYLEACSAIHTYDKISVSETYLSQDTLLDDDNLRIPGYELIRFDRPLNQKTSRYLFIKQRFSPNKSKQCKLFERIFKFQSECKCETV